MNASSSNTPLSIPLGGRIPDSPHGVSVSLPTLRDVIAYEEKEPQTMAKVRSGYPRFVRHPFIETLSERFLAVHDLDAGSVQPFFFAAPHAAQDALERLGEYRMDVQCFQFQSISTLVAARGSEAERLLAKYIQHTGTGLSSREAEERLMELEPTRQRFPEQKVMTGANERFRYLLHRWFAPAARSAILPCKSGMNAFYASFQAINQLQKPKHRRDWISVGWLYLDTMQILDAYLESGGRHHAFTDVANTEALLDFIQAEGHRIAGLVLEAPSNPLVQTPQIARISEACQQAGILTVMDPSLVSPRNVDLSPLCDIVCCSLTKYAVFEGDVMIGAVSVNLERPNGRELEEQLTVELTLAHARDLARLGASLEQAIDVLERINANTLKVAAYLESHRGVKHLHWAYADAFRDAYAAIARGPDRPGGVLTLDLARSLEQVYDCLPFAKGPSFGTEFTLVCPYIHLAHYDLLKSEAGRRCLDAAGIHGNMIRLSVGTEDPEVLIEQFERCL